MQRDLVYSLFVRPRYIACQWMSAIGARRTSARRWANDRFWPKADIHWALRHPAAKRSETAHGWI